MPDPVTLQSLDARVTKLESVPVPVPQPSFFQSFEAFLSSHPWYAQALNTITTLATTALIAWLSGFVGTPVAKGGEVADSKPPVVWRPTPTLEEPDKGNNCFFYDHSKYKAKLKYEKVLFNAWPAPPKTFDHGLKISYPMLLNDQLGCCFYSAICHQDQTFTGGYGPQSNFDLKVFRQRYLALSGGDNGLADQDVQGEWSKRYLADVTAAKAFDFFYIDVNNPSVLAAAIYEMGGVQFTFVVAPDWINNSDTGAVWDVGGFSRNNNGHAVHLVGVDSRGYFKLITWGTYVWITPAAVKVCSADSFVVASTRWFDEKGYCATGKHITAVSKVIQDAGGKAFPASVINSFPPIGPPVPPVPPVPPTPPIPPGKDTITITTNIGGKTTTTTYRIVPANAEVFPAGTKDKMKALIDSLVPPPVELKPASKTKADYERELAAINANFKTPIQPQHPAISAPANMTIAQRIAWWEKNYPQYASKP